MLTRLSSGLVVVVLVGACGAGESSSAGVAPNATPPANDAPPVTPTASPPASPPSDPPAASTSDWDHDGAIAYDVTVEHVTNGAHTFDVTLYMPKSAGAHAAVSLSCGSSQTAAGYVPYARRLASHGIAMVLHDDPGALVKTTDIVEDSVAIVDAWIPSALAGKVDVARIGLAGHSRGGAVSLLTAERLAGKVVAWFGLDPVDSQFVIAPGAYARTNIAKIGIPTAYLGASVESNCAPAADSYPMLYPASPSPSVLIVGKGAGHTQLEPAAACTACTICSPSGTADPDVVLAYAVRYFAAFFARELLHDATIGAAFEGAGAAADIAAGRVTIASK
jgi:pimeloyl-ACP methyl ester carboxylesterase